jgi:hypothetical protein
LTDPGHCACEVCKGFERVDGFLAAQCDAAESFEFVEAAFDQMPLFAEPPVNRSIFTAGWIAFDMGWCDQIIRDEVAQVAGIMGCVHDDVTHSSETLDQAARLRAVPPLAGCDCEPDRQSGRINSGMYFCGQAAFGTAMQAASSPPFERSHRREFCR